MTALQEHPDNYQVSTVYNLWVGKDMTTDIMKTDHLLILIILIVCLSIYSGGLQLPRIFFVVTFVTLMMWTNVYSTSEVVNFTLRTVPLYQSVMNFSVTTQFFLRFLDKFSNDHQIYNFWHRTLIFWILKGTINIYKIKKHDQQLKLIQEGGWLPPPPPPPQARQRKSICRSK